MYALKRLVNHEMTNDVTAGYIISDVERLRKPMLQYLSNCFDISKSETIKKYRHSKNIETLLATNRIVRFYSK